MFISVVLAETGPVVDNVNEFQWGNIVLVLGVTMLILWLVRTVISVRRTAKHASDEVARLRQELNDFEQAVQK